ncbi:hypothetical protein [Cupriavidus sp. TMH.W2]|uniref:hypothetical protein n=1 Tax=Cupriavidus sp. TMH.W2 TaxID=3434465 RepID=UPI003D775DED
MTPIYCPVSAPAASAIARELGDMLTSVAMGCAAATPCGTPMSASALFWTGLQKQLTQAGGNVALAVDDAMGGLTAWARFPHPLIELDGVEYPLDRLDAAGRLQALFRLWALDRTSFPLLVAVLADKGHDWREFKEPACASRRAAMPYEPSAGAC